MAKTYKSIQGFFCFVLVCVLVFNCFAIPRAQALTAEMTLGVAVTALVCLIISSLGVTIQAAQGQDVTDYVGSYFTSWVQDKGYSDVGSWFTAVTGVSVVGWICKVGAGFLAVGKLVYDAVSQFVSYFVAEQGIESGGEPVGNISSGVTVTPVGNTSLAWSSSFVAQLTSSWTWSWGTYSEFGVNISGDFPANTVISLSALPSGVQDSYVQYYQVGSSSVSGTLNFRRNSVDTTRVTLPYACQRLNIRFTNYYYSGGRNYYIGGSGTNVVTEITFSSAVNATTGALLTPGSDVVGLPSITDDQSYRVIDSDIAVSAGVAGNLANILNKAGTTEGIQTVAAVADTPVNPPDTSPIEGLQDVFPFCLPFDFARFLEIFSAQREAPRFEWVIPLSSATGLGLQDQTLTIDLSDFDDLAATVRNVELIAMCIGLILLTRELLKW